MSTNPTRDQIKAAYLAGQISPADLIELHRATFGAMRMEADLSAGDPAPVEKPEGVTDDEWSALGDPGKRAIVRERERAAKAERELQLLRSQPKPVAPKSEPKPEPAKGEAPDLAELVRKAVAEAVAPVQQEITSAEVKRAVTGLAADRLHDPSDALAQIPVDQLTDDRGYPDPTKIKAALDDLVKRKPYLAKATDDRRRPAPGSFVGGTQSSASLDERKKAVLDRMQQTSGVRIATQ